MTEIKEPDCPSCGRPPGMALSPLQAFCLHEDCTTFSWNMTKTRAENMADVNIIDLSGLPFGDESQGTDPQAAP